MATRKSRAHDEKSQSIRVLVVDDHPVVRAGLHALLSSAGMTVVGEAINGLEALEAVRRLRPDVVLMDVKMPDADGLSATKAIREQSVNIPVLLISNYDSLEYVRQSILSGASGYLLKDVSREALIDAIKLVLSGKTLFEGTIVRELLEEGKSKPPDQSPDQRLRLLSPVEKRVLTLLAQGLTNKEISQQMHYSVSTVKNIVQRITTKLGVTGRIQAATLAAQEGINPSREAGD